MIKRNLSKVRTTKKSTRVLTNLGKPPKFFDPYAPPPKVKTIEPFSIDTITKERASYFINSIGKRHSNPYQRLVDDLITLQRKNKLIIPPKPKEWLRKPGWYRYTYDSVPEKVDYPLEDLLVFDVERLYNISQYPTMATACSTKAWYGWVSKYIADPSNEDPTDMIPLNPKNERKIVIGHNVSFDRALVSDDYDLERNASRTFYVDTMGVYTQAFPYYTQVKLDEKNVFDPFVEPYFNKNECKFLHIKDIRKGLALKTLVERYTDIKMNKDARSEFEATDKRKIINQFNRLMDYCADDVVATFSLFMKLYPQFKTHITSPSQLLALKEMGNSKVFVDSLKWRNIALNNNRKSSDAITLATDTIEQIAKSKGLSIKKAPRFSSNTVKNLMDVSFEPKYIPRRSKVPYEEVFAHSKSLLFKVLTPLWFNGTFKPTTPESERFVHEALKPHFWEHTKERITIPPVLPLNNNQEECSIILPLVKTINGTDLTPNEPFWLSNPAPADCKFEQIGQPVDQYLVTPSDFSQISISLNHNYLKTIIESPKNKLETISPYLTRQHVNQLQTEYLYDLLTCTKELFQHFKIHKYHLLTTFNRSLSFAIPKDQEAVGQLALELAQYWVELAIYHQTKIKSNQQEDEYVEKLREKCNKVLKGVPAIGFEFVSMNWRDFKYNKYLRLADLQKHLDSAVDRGSKRATSESDKHFSRL